MKKVPKTVLNWFGKHWRGVLVSIILSVLAVVTLSLQLSSLVPGQNRFETETLAIIEKFPTPWERAVNAPYTIPAHLLGNAINDPLHAARIVSVAYGLIATALMFYVVRSWFNIKIATVGTLLFITSSWLLHTTHQATPIILLVFGPLLAVAALTWFLRTKKYKTLSFFLLAAALALTAYIPYMPWIVLVAFIVIVFVEKKIIKDLKTWQIITAASIYTLILLPLFASLIKYPGQLHELLGIPKVLPSLAIYFDQFIYTFSMIAFRSAPFPELHLGRLPMLDIFSAAMFALGIYYFAVRIKTRRSIILFSSMVLLFILVPLSPLYQLSATILMSFVFLCVISGIVELLNQWFAYFPRNPWARNFGVAMIVVAIGFASFYHLERYFIAWPNTPETKSVYIVVSNPKP